MLLIADSFNSGFCNATLRFSFIYGSNLASKLKFLNLSFFLIGWRRAPLPELRIFKHLFHCIPRKKDSCRLIKYKLLQYF